MIRSTASVLLLAGCAWVGVGEVHEGPPLAKPVTEDWRFHQRNLEYPIYRERVRIWELCSGTFPPLSAETLRLCVQTLKPKSP